LSWPKFSIGLASHSDANIRWLTNFLFAYDFNQLRQWVFSQGTLAFLQFPLPLESNRLWAYLILGALRIIILLSIFQSPPDRWGVSLFKKSAVFLLLVQIAGHHQIFLLGIVALVMWDQKSERTWRKILLISLIALLWQIRLIPAIGASILVLVYFLFEGRNKFWAVAVPIGLLASDLLFLQELSLISNKWKGLLHLALNNTELTESGVVRTPFLLFTLIGCGFLIVHQLRVKSLIWLCFLGFITFYYISRPDEGTALVLTKLAIIISLLLVVNEPSFKVKPLLVYVGSLVLIVAPFYYWFPSRPLMQKWRPLSAWNDTFWPTSAKLELKEPLEELNIKPSPLKESLQVFPGHYLGFSRIGDTIITGPIPQAYYVLNGQLDSLQANSLLTSNKPRKVYVHLDPLNKSLNIGGQNLWHKAPRYFDALFQHYFLAFANGDYMEFEMRQKAVEWEELDRFILKKQPILIELESSKYAYRINGLPPNSSHRLLINGKRYSLSQLNSHVGAQIWPLGLDSLSHGPLSLGIDGNDTPVILERVPLFEASSNP